jgi:hypothetical protein
MALNADSPEINEAIQVFSEDPYVFTALFSCNESLFFLTNDDYIVSYGYNHHGCLGVRHENTVNTLLHYKPNMRNETVFELAPSADFTFFLTHNGSVYVSGLSPFNGAITNTPTLFEPLERSYITQIRAAKKYCIALEGGHKDFNSTTPPPGSYKDFPIATEAETYYTGQRGSPTRVTPFPADYTHFWYFPGDIISRSDWKAKVVGLSDGKPAAAIAKYKRIVVVDDASPLEAGIDLLQSRSLAAMLIVRVRGTGVSVHVDQRDEVISKFGGFLQNDIVQTDDRAGGTIVGVRGPFLWVRAQGGDGCAAPWREDQLRLVDVNRDRRLITVVGDRGVLVQRLVQCGVLSPELGLCELVGKDQSGVYLRGLGRQNAEMYPAATAYEIVQVQRDSAHDGDGLRPSRVVTRSYEVLVLSQVITEGLITRLDRVRTPRGHGTMLGLLDGAKCVVLTDREFFTDCRCDVFGLENVELVGKMRNVPWTVQAVLENGQRASLHVDPLAFAGREVMICDRVRARGRLGYVCGIDGSDIYVKWDDRNGPSKLSGDAKIEVVMRYAMIPLIGAIGDVKFSKSIISFSGTWVKPGDVLQEGERVIECVGIENNGLLVFVDQQSHEIVCRDRGGLDLSGLHSDAF